MGSVFLSKNFSKIKKELENDWLAESIKGRLKYHLTKYRKSHDVRGRIAVLIDGKEVYCANDLTTEVENYDLWSTDGENINKAFSNGFLHTSLFYESYNKYTCQSIEYSISSQNALIRLFAIFDRRIGKRRFKELKQILICKAHWLEQFYDFRYHCEYKE